MPIEVITYETADGDSPVDDFITRLEPKMRNKVLRTLELLEAFGPALREPDSKHLGDGIFELRTKQSTNIVRCLYFFYSGGRAVVTNGFVKKTKKTPRGQIDLATARRADWERRNK